MSFWKRLFGRTSPQATPRAPTPPLQGYTPGDVPVVLDYAALFVDRVRTHRSRMMAAGDIYKVFLQEHLADDILIEVLAPVAADKMASTSADGKEHSQMLAKAPVSYVICTVPVSPQECAGWFEQRFGGYLKLLESLWNSETYRTVAAEVLCHITYGKMDREVWVNISVFPVQSTDFAFQPILATDLLSQAERAQLGM